MSRHLHDPDTGDERELRNLFERTVPPVVPVDIDELLRGSLSRRSQIAADGSPRKPSALDKLMTTRNGLTVGIVASVLCALVIAVPVFQPVIAFSEVKEQVAATRSVRYTETRVNGQGQDQTAADAKNAVVAIERRLAKIEESLEAAEGDEKEQLLEERRQIEEELDSAAQRIQAHGDRPWETRVMNLGRFLKRRETPTVWGEIIYITNMQTGEWISINHQQRSVRRLTTHITIDEETGGQTESEIRGSDSANLYATLRNIPDDAAELPDRKFVDDVSLIGFRSVEQHGADTWTRTVWVDPDSRLPRQIHTQVRSTNPRHAACDWYESDIEFDVPLDESLFSTEPPAGYTVKETTVYGVRPSENSSP